jgi:hypothetical protein
MSQPETTGRDPARARFFAISVTRLIGVACVILGILIHQGRIDGAQWLGWLLLANGLFDIFVLPLILARRWRTPKP